MPASDYFNRQKEETMQRRQNPGIRLFTFDIETECHPDAESVFEPTFEPKEEEKPKIRTNLVDPIKILAAQEDLVARMAEWERKRAESVTEQREAWIGEGALRAERGRILAIGYKVEGKIITGDIDEHGGSENRLIEAFLGNLLIYVNQGYTVAGFNIADFDLPFIRRRCLILGIPFPFYDRNEKWKPWKFPIYDAMKDWQCGVYGSGAAIALKSGKVVQGSKYISLDCIARALGVGKKTGDGAQFSELYRTDREAALSYLSNDVSITEGVCKRLLGI